MKPLRRHRLAKGLVVAVLLMAACEVGCRALFGPPPAFDLHSRVSQCALEIGDDEAALSCPASTDAPPRFPLDPQGRQRVLVFGGSSMVQPRGASVPELLQRTLGPEVEVLSLAVPGMGVANVARLVSESRALSPDLVVLYTGHNDYSQDTFRGAITGTRLWLLPVYALLRESWIHALLSRGRMAAGGPVKVNRPMIVATDDDLALHKREQVNERLRADLELALASSPAAVLLSTLLRNSEAPPTGTLTDSPACEEALQQLARADPLTEALERSEALCGEGSLTWWLRSRVLLAQGREREAAEAFDRSLDLDPVPLRAPAETDRIIRELGQRPGVRVVDMELPFGHMPEGRYFTDTLHLSAEGAEAVAEVLAPAVREELGL